MKKLMMLIAALGLAGVARGTSVTWTFEGGTGNYFTSEGFSFLFITDADNLSTLQSYVAGGATYATVLELRNDSSICSCGSDLLSSDSNAGTDVTLSSSVSLTDSVSRKIAYQLQVNGGLADDSFYALALVVDASNTDNTIVSYVLTSQISATASSLTTLDTLTATFSNAAATLDANYDLSPEPTSAILLLLGTAGLMLRRKTRNPLTNPSAQ